MSLFLTYNQADQSIKNIMVHPVERGLTKWADCTILHQCAPAPIPGMVWWTMPNPVFGLRHNVDIMWPIFFYVSTTNFFFEMMSFTLKNTIIFFLCGCQTILGHFRSFILLQVQNNHIDLLPIFSLKKCHVLRLKVDFS